MEKPITILKEEFMNDLVQLINNSKLPYFIVEYIIKDVYTQVQQINLQEEKNIKQKYYESLENEEEK